jgi:hypothetical protein
MKTTHKTVTPQLAAEMLSNMVANRNLSRSHVVFLANEIRGGRWCQNGETIKTCRGQVIDGQHRLRAIIEAGQPIPCLLVDVDDPRAFASIDSGMVRKPAHVLGIDGFKNTTTLAATVRIILHYKTARVSSRGGHTKIANSQVRELVDQYAGVADLVSFWESRKQRVKFAPASIFAACDYLFREKSEADAAQFLLAVMTGERLDGDSPAFALRERLINNHTSRVRFGVSVVMFFFIRSWNAYRNGERLRRLAIPTEFTDATQLPEII